MKISTITTSLLCGTLLATAVPTVSVAEGTGFFRDIRPNHWVWNGADPNTTNEVLARVRAASPDAEYSDLADGEGATIWLEEFNQIGDGFVAMAEEQEALGLTGAAAELYMRASANYTLAKYPLIDPSPQESAAFEASLDTLHRAYKLRGYDVARVTAPFMDGMADGHLLTPPGQTPAGGWPLVIASNGIDVNQGEFFTFAEMVADRGMAFLMYDIAGTGTNAEFQLTPDYDQIPVSFAETLGATDAFDANRIAVLGVSFGGNAVVKLAHTRPDLIAAAVNFCGPLHAAFQLPADQLENVGLMYRLALYDRTEIDGSVAPDAFLAHMRGFSLIDQGIVTPGEATTDVPILSVNARGDYVAPEFDMELATGSTTDGQIIWNGEGDHCPQDRFEVMPQIADWLEDKLAVVQG
ncbi:alpha/beta hydrolase [Yoonia sp. SS1-5]|uniref:Alpha/beta hydrolase n=1 Tax=Yoonia rhodophyticola TaxID=3137370 RepID=A0AAN0NJZ6_9RHOB